MSTSTVTQTFGDAEYTTTTLDAETSLKVWPYLALLLGDSLVALILAGDETLIQEIATNPKSAAGNFLRVCKNATKVDEHGNELVPGGLLYLKQLLVNTTCSKIPLGETFVEGNVAENFNKLFTGEMMLLFQVSMWVATASFK